MAAILKTKGAIWWLWLPALFFSILVIAELTVPYRIIAFLVNENGLLEIGQFIILVCAFLAALLCLKSINFKTQKFLALWFTLAALGCFYTGGEEVSWGQQFFKWATPESWLAINDQQETNFHNTSSWLDQKPRLILELGVIFGGLVLPLIMRLRPALIPAWLRTIAPPANLAAIAAIVLAVKIFDKIADNTDFAFFHRPSEITEFYVYYFILLYLLMLLERQKA